MCYYQRIKKLKDKGRDVTTIDYSKDEKEMLVEAAVRFREESERGKNDEFEQAYEDMPYLYKYINENAKEVREKNKEALKEAGKNSNGFIDKLIKDTKTNRLIRYEDYKTLLDELGIEYIPLITTLVKEWEDYTAAVL
jgi:vacuolar-type H+-ATPase subunit H